MVNTKNLRTFKKNLKTSKKNLKTSKKNLKTLKKRNINKNLRKKTKTNNKSTKGGMKFGTAVLVLPYREKIVTTKMITAIQELSNNRFLLGIGPGYLEEEFKALGINIKERGKLTNEMLEFLLNAAENSKVVSNGQEILIEPKLNLPPIYIGQMAKVAFKRTIRFAKGWMPVSISAEELRPKVIELNKLATAAGREKLEVIAMKTLPLDDIESAQQMAIAYKEAGATQLVHTQGYENVEHYGEIIEILEKSIKPLI